MLLGIIIFFTIARAIISWVNADPYNPIVRMLVSTTEPLLYPIRKYVPLVGGGLDLSPIILIFAAYFLKAALVVPLADYASVLRAGALQG